MKCPICGGELELISTSILYSNKYHSRCFKLICKKCKLQSREANVYTSVNEYGEIEKEDIELKELLKEWGMEK